MKRRKLSRASGMVAEQRRRLASWRDATKTQTSRARSRQDRGETGVSSGRRAATALRRGLTVSNPDKVFWPEERYTKLDLVRFYDWVFPWLAPYVRDRLLTLRRCPDGLRGSCFYQKEKPATLPSDTPTCRIVYRNGVRNHVVGGRRETQLALANLGCISVHISMSRASAPRRPDIVCFDLDPDSGRFADAARAGRHLKEALDALGLPSFPKTSGKKGLHVFVPIRVGPDANEARDFAERLGAVLAHAHPDEITMEFQIARRRGRVYLDPGRNGFMQTVAAPYCVRRAPGAPVSTPLTWDEVQPELDPTRFNIRTMEARLRVPDPWADFSRSRRPLATAAAALARL